MSCKINVLLASFNGERFLQHQLESILAQTHKEIIIHIRDDDSKDKTVTILEEYQLNHPNIKVTYGSNIGVIDSFFTLLKEADPSCNYYAFCDQDDYWQSDKLARAINLLSKEDQEKPLLYCSKVEFVDARLQHLGYSQTPSQIGFGNALVENIAAGCTIVINKKARDLILSTKPQLVLMHDWWFYLVISAFGKVIYDENSYIKYRQHGGNTVGGSPSPIANFYRRIKRFMKADKNTYRVGDQARAFFDCYGENLDLKNQIILNRFLNSKSNLISRISYSLSMDVWRQSLIDTFILRVLIILGYY
jgi:glycosyltransferase involved in cell wall biosynthesis